MGCCIDASAPGRTPDGNSPAHEFTTSLNIKVLYVERIVLDELAAPLELVANQRRERQVRFHVILGADLRERARLRVHRGRPERVRVHLAEALVAVDRHALLAGGGEELDEVVQRLYAHLG